MLLLDLLLFQFHKVWRMAVQVTQRTKSFYLAYVWKNKLFYAKLPDSKLTVKIRN